MRVPSLPISIDESLFPYRGHISIKNYNPNKPARYGLLFKSIPDAEVPNTYYNLTYAGKPVSRGRMKNLCIWLRSFGYTAKSSWFNV